LRSATSAFFRDVALPSHARDLCEPCAALGRIAVCHSRAIAEFPAEKPSGILALAS
jgi:hypothetical protein